MPQMVCLECANTRVVMEYRLVWKAHVEGMEPRACSRRVGSEEEGRRLLRDLGEEMFDAEFLSGARACPSCAARAGPVVAVAAVAAAPEPERWWMQ